MNINVTVYIVSVPKVSCIKGLVPRLSLLEGGGIFKKMGLIGH